MDLKSCDNRSIPDKKSYVCKSSSPLYYLLPFFNSLKVKSHKRKLKSVSTGSTKKNVW